MSKQAPRWLNGLFFNESTSDAQKKYFAGSLSFYSDEETIDKFCDQLKGMAKMCREIDEKYLKVKITRNKDKDAKTEFSFERDDWDKTGAKAEKVKAWEGGGEPSKPKQAESSGFADEEDIPF